MNEIDKKLDALELIFAAPIWPSRKELCKEGASLFDSIIENAKAYALFVVGESYQDAFAIAGAWSGLANKFIGSSLIKGNATNEKMLNVFKYYIDLLNMNLLEINK